MQRSENAEIEEMKKLLSQYESMCTELTAYKHKVSYNETYFDVPEGHLKSTLKELDMLSCKTRRVINKKMMGY